ncbi:MULTISPECIES: helix-turn-helix transcriptional regulator [unclassified Streptomyces]|uniref:helix-turn-helix domain-containing protein n=1 Tax=unclassified Streptomyces TaxID=2593676 RepID=UPI002E0EFCA9|nr:helix-turn-helix transcriptional regulator [Streptomyces sp. NBC_01197]WSS49718.1 helix-turn-helix transcriptional regulator [Streptomyces sp. NBC_01180]
MSGAPKSRSIRQKYGEELRIRRIAAGLTQEAVSEGVVCSPTLVSHWEAGRRLPTPDDAQRLDLVLGTDGFFARWLKDLDSKYAEHFAAAAELEKLAKEIKQYGASLVPGLLQTEAYARAVLRAYRPNYKAEELDQLVVNRVERARILADPVDPVIWTLLDEAVLRRRVGGPAAMATQLGKIADMAENGRLRVHVVPFKAGEHALMEGMVSLMSFADAAPVAYVEGLCTGSLMDDPALVSECRAAYDLVLGDALSFKESVALIRAVSREHERDQQ